jgi:hypothetical protein
MVPLFVLILIAAVLWRQRHRPTAKRLFVATLPPRKRERPKPPRPIRPR